MKNTKNTIGAIGCGIAVVALILLAANASAGSIYKWVDSNGVVHYGDQVPPKYVTKQREVLNQQGIVVNRLAAQETSKELAAAKKKREAARKAAAAHKKQEQRDKFLLNSYRSVSDIKDARETYVNAIVTRISITQNTIDSIQQALKPLQKRADKKKTVPAKLAQRIDNLKAQLAENQSALKDEQTKLARTKKQFEQDIARFKTLQTRNAPQP